MSAEVDASLLKNRTERHMGERLATILGHDLGRTLAAGPGIAAGGCANASSQ